MEPDLGSWQSPDISRSHLYRGTIAWTPINRDISGLHCIWSDPSLNYHQAYPRHISKTIHQENAFENVTCKLLAILARPQCVKWKTFLKHLLDFQLWIELMGFWVSLILTLLIFYTPAHLFLVNGMWHETITSPSLMQLSSSSAPHCRSHTSSPGTILFCPHPISLWPPVVMSVYNTVSTPLVGYYSIPQGKQYRITSGQIDWNGWKNNNL